MSRALSQAEVNQAKTSHADGLGRTTMNGKPVHTIPAKTVINFESGFAHKLLCDGLSFSVGSSCGFSCSYCYVPSIMRKQRPYYASLGIVGRHEDIVIRRGGAVERLRAQLMTRTGEPKFRDDKDCRVIYASPLVDVAANVELALETIVACNVILELTNWHIRLLSKSNLLPFIARALPATAKRRVIFGVSTGTLDDKLALALEPGTPLVSKRLASLHQLQDEGYRTFGMICPSLPQKNYDHFGQRMAEAIRAGQCENVWAEVINVRGESMHRTVAALQTGGFDDEARMVEEVSTETRKWEDYSRQTFLAHVPYYPPGKLRYMQYVNRATREWWKAREHFGAIVL